MEDLYLAQQICMDCNNQLATMQSKRDAAFWTNSKLFPAICGNCGSTRFSESRSLPPYDWELVDEWRKDESLKFLDQDEDLMLAEEKYIIYLAQVIDAHDSLRSKKGTAIEALYILVYDNLPSDEEPYDEEVAKAALNILRNRKESVTSTEPFVSDDVKLAVDEYIGIE